ncbi:MAG TPA: hypothetical protein VKR61_10545 [Bryobacteraceae bacterium]|nr:hypothetical protein [Bryobacteraceae bacterium]
MCLVALFIGQHRSLAQSSAPTQQADRSAAPVAESTRTDYGTYIPLTQKERLRYYFSHMFSVESVFRSAAGAGINQAMNTPSEWGQGGEGYGRRFASSYAGHIVQSTVMYGAGAVLHEDNRYFRCPDSGVGTRLKYAIVSTFMARHDDGSRHFSWSRIGSYGAAAAISRAWQPPSTRGPVNFADSFAIFVGAEAGFNVAREFLPSIFRSRAPVTTTQDQPRP